MNDSILQTSNFIKDIIEKDKARAEYIANELNNTIVINGNGLDEDVLNEANLEDVETVLALTNDDEDNLMVSVLVEKFAKDEKDIDDKRTMALINKPNYSLLQNSLKIDDLINKSYEEVSLKIFKKGINPLDLPFVDLILLPPALIL